MIFPPWSNVYAMTSLKNPTYGDKEILKDKIYINDVEDLVENTMAMANLVRKFGNQNWRYDYTSN